MKNYISWIIAAVVYPIALVIGFKLTSTFDGEKWWIVALVAIAGHIFLSFGVINERQLGAMFIFGRAVGDLESGLYFAFWPFCYVRKETKNIVQIEIGVLTEEERQKAKTLEASASVYLMEDPLRVNWGDIKSADGTPEDKKKEEAMFKGNPYAEAMVTDTHATVRFRICSLSRLINHAGSLIEGIELIRGVVVSTLISHAGKSFVGRAIHDMEAMNKKLREAVEEFVVDPNTNAYKAAFAATGKPHESSWGVDVKETQITRLGTAKRINVAIADKGKVIYEAQGERTRLQEVGAGQAKAIELKAQADKVRLTKEGAGNAEAERLLLIARKVGLQQLAMVAGTPKGLIVLQLEALERALKEGKPVIIPMELSKILGALGDKLVSPPLK